MKRTLSVLLVAGLGFWAGPAAAALYRCGSVFQDRPCDAGVQQPVLKPDGKGAPAPAPAASAASATASVANPACRSLLTRRQGIETRLRTAEPGTVAMLERQRRDADKSLADAGC
jgi:hypothetical protein